MLARALIPKNGLIELQSCIVEVASMSSLSAASIGKTSGRKISGLRKLRSSPFCVSKNGSKAVVWQRLKREVTHRKLQLGVEASEAVQAEYARDPAVDALPKPPSPELVELHEVIHLPRADCSMHSCAIKGAQL